MNRKIAHNAYTDPTPAGTKLGATHLQARERKEKRTMRYLSTTLAVLGLALILILSGCGPRDPITISGSGGGEEASAAQLALTDTFDQVRAGARLILSYDPAANAFTGTVENTTMATLNRVRVEVHLSNGMELGPTTPVDLAPGQIVAVTLPAGSQPFNSWVAHAEVGGGGAGEAGGEGAGEHGGGAGEGGGEHR